MYEFTGSHFRSIVGSNGASPRRAFGYRRKYLALCRKVAETSVSRRAVLPHFGHDTRYHDSTRASGDTPVSSGLKSSTFGSSTGRSLSGTGTTPQLSQ